MKGCPRQWILLFSIVVLTGCGGVSRQITLKSQSERADIFKEMRGAEPISKEFVELTITSSIKTHVEGFYPLESKNSLHEKPGYPFVINIDGQAATWKIDGQKENVSMYDEKGKKVPKGERG